MSLEQFERRLSAVVDSLFAKGSDRGLEPAELARRMVREIERQSRVGIRSQIAPNVFKIGLCPEDYEDLAPMRQTVLKELISLAEETIAEGSYQLVGPLSVEILEDKELRVGTFYVDCSFTEEQGYRDRWELVGASGPPIELSSGVHTIGRLPGSEVFVEDPRVSRRHAEIRIVDGEVTLRDLGSTNGTFVNGTRVTRPVVLADGDQITVGTTEYLLRRS